MARKTDKPAKSEGEARPETDRRKKLLTRVRDAAKRLPEADHDNRVAAMADLKFCDVPGEQWDANQKKRRGKRPCYEFNLTGTRVKRIINDMRSNRAYGKVRGFEDSDKDTAEVIEGLIRNIANQSDFDAIQDYAAGYQVKAGMGAWRVETKYSDDTTFDQDIAFSQIDNPFNLYLTDDEGIYFDRISNAEYERRWPKADRTDFESHEFDDDDEWQDENTTRICEYWYKEPTTKELVLLADGRTVEASQVPADAEVRSRRTIRTHKVKMCIASGSAILEEQDFAGKYIPLVQVFGEKLVIDGKTRWWGAVRGAKDAARSCNVANTAIVETIATAPRSFFWATPENAKGNAEKWASAHDENLPAQLFNPDPKNGGVAPQRIGGADVPVALMQQATIAEQLLNGVMGIHEASLGQEGGEKSGRAIIARQQQGDLATYNFKANMAEGVRRTWMIAADLIPRIYTNERSMRVLGPDGAEKYVKVNAVQIDPQTLQAVPVNDLTRGKYDVVITVGPSYSTQRLETLDAVMQLAQGNPQVIAVAGDIIAEMIDAPKSEQLAARLRAVLPPQVQAVIGQDKPLPPEVQSAMAQVQAGQQQIQQQAQLLQQAAAEAETDKAAADKAKSDVQIALANLKAEEARFEALIAKQMAQIQVAQVQSDAQTQATDFQQFAQQAEQVLAAVQAEQARLSQSLDTAISMFMPPDQGPQQIQ